MNKPKPYSMGGQACGRRICWPLFTKANTWRFDNPWYGKLPNVIISYRSTP